MKFHLREGWGQAIEGAIQAWLENEQEKGPEGVGSVYQTWVQEAVILPIQNGETVLDINLELVGLIQNVADIYANETDARLSDDMDEEEQQHWHTLMAIKTHITAMDSLLEEFDVSAAKEAKLAL